MKQTRFFVYIIIIIGIVIFIYYNLHPVVHPVSKSGRRNSCIHNMLIVGSILSNYSKNNDLHYPISSGDKGLGVLFLEQYIEDRRILKCPRDKVRENFDSNFDKKENNSQNNSPLESEYIYLGGFREDIEPEVPILFDKLGNHKDYCNVLFSNGKVKGYELKYSSYEELVEYIGRKKHYSDETLDTIKQKIAKALKNNKSAEEKK